MVNLAQEIIDWKGTKPQLREPRSFNASRIGGTHCDLYLYNFRINWAQVKLWDGEAQCRMDEGNHAEERTRRELTDLGWNILSTLETRTNVFYWPEYDIGGKVDGFAVKGSDVILYEHKNVSDHVFDSFSDQADFLRDFWHERWLTQLGIYMYQNNWGGQACFLLRNRGVPKQIDVTLDFVTPLVSEVLERIVRVRPMIAALTPPEPRLWDSHICGSCEFIDICNVVRPSLHQEVFYDPELERTLAERWLAESAGREFDRLDRKAKAILKPWEFDQAVCGDFVITRDNNRTKIERMEDSRSELLT